MGCPACGTHTGTHWPDCPHGSQPHATRDERDQWKAEALIAVGALREIAAAEASSGKDTARVTLQSIEALRKAQRR